MCFKWFASLFKPDPDPEPATGEKVGILFAINNYPGSQNDLNGCLNDQEDTNEDIEILFPDFNWEKYKDSNVSRETFRNEVKNHITAAVSGDVLLIGYSGHGTYGIDPYSTEADGYSEALYLYDGPFWDYEFAELLKLIPIGVKVIIALDSCFSKGSTKYVNPYQKSKFMPIQKLSSDVKRKKAILRSEDMNYVLFSGCGERETSADAFIDGRYNGAFTYFWLKTIEKGITYKQWIDRLHQYLPSNEYEQNPGLDGREDLLNNKIFE